MSRTNRRLRALVAPAVALALVTPLAACASPTALPAPLPPPPASISSPSPTPAMPSPALSSPPAAPRPAGGLADPARRRVADAVISSFENSSTALPYESAERLDDGRGITAGRAGFTSGTHDLVLVVQRYERAGGSGAVSRYAAALQAVDARVRAGGDGDDTAGLDGFEAAWRQTSRADPRLNRAQDAVYDQLYFTPAMAAADRAGVRSALGQLVLLDSAVQHGTDDDPDGLPTMIAETDRSRAATGDEPGWLRSFLTVRRAHLRHPHDPETAEVWRASTPRVDTLTTLLDQGRLDLATPLGWTFAGQSFHAEG